MLPTLHGPLLPSRKETGVWQGEAMEKKDAGD